MKDGIHPQYFDTIDVTCSCGNSFQTGSTVEKIEVEVCSNCHPFYTGKQKLVDTAGRVDKFRKRMEAKADGSTNKKEKARKEKQQDKETKLN